MKRLFSDVLKDRNIFSEEDEKEIHLEAQKIVQETVKKHEAMQEQSKES